MRKYLLALPVFALTARLATAQDGKNPVVPEKVTYSRAIPKSLFAFLPRGGKSRFWGATKLKYNGQKIWVHVYDVRRAREDAPQKSALDLFIFSKSRKLQRIISNRFEYSRLDGYSPSSKPETIGVETLWLDTKHKIKPIVEISIKGDKSVYGDEIQKVFVIFYEDFKSATIDNRFGEFSAVTSDWWVSFGVDEEGLLTIISDNSSPSGISETTYKWINNCFTPVAKQFKDWSEGSEFKPVPLDTARKTAQPLAGFGVGNVALGAMPKPSDLKTVDRRREPMKSDDDEEDEEAEGF